MARSAHSRLMCYFIYFRVEAFLVKGVRSVRAIKVLVPLIVNEMDSTQKNPGYYIPFTLGVIGVTLLVRDTKFCIVVVNGN